MSRESQLLARSLSELGTRHPIRLPTLSHDLRFAVGRLFVTGMDTCEVQLGPGAPLPAEIGAPLRAAIAEQADGVWILDVPAETTEGTAVPFCPPHVARIDGPLPVRVPESLVPHLKEVRLELGADLAKQGVLRVAGEAKAVLGLRTLAALDEEDAARMTWWLPSGDALELRLCTDLGGAWLHLVDLVQTGARESAHSGPTALLDVGPEARFVLEPPSSSARGQLGVAAALRPARSELMDAWVRYAVAAREEQVDRQRRRQAHPLTFRDARQDGKAWSAEVVLSAEAQTAWLGKSVEEGRRLRIAQPVGLDGVDGNGGRYTLTTMTLRGPGVARAELQPDRGAGPLPVTGRLIVREDVGAKVKEDRERLAIETLAAGRAACRRLPLLLRRPGEATPPRLAPLRKSPTELLDADQHRAVQLIVDCRDIVAIQGPPGTGKTRVIVEALRQLAARRRRGEPPLRVLVSSVQNEAVGNVAERLAGAEGLLVRLVQRAGRDQDEDLSFARRMDAEREACVSRLRAALRGFEFLGRLDALGEAGKQVDAVRTAALARQRASCATRLAAVVEEVGAELSMLLREEAARLCSQLEAPPPAAQEPATPGPAIRVAVPESPAGLAEWWAAEQGRLPAHQRADIGFQVQQVLDALASGNGPRRDRQVARRWDALVPALAAVAGQEPTAGPTPRDEGEDGGLLFAKVDAWCVQARHELSDAEGKVLQQPQAIAQRFLRALESEPGAWQRIVNNHGGTVAATCSMSAKAALPPGEHYDWVIIDEAGIASPFELLVPMVQGQRVVLIGDHRQLPPIVDQNLAKRANRGLPVDLDQETLFGELFRLLPPGCKGRLSTQYRMHGEIGSVVDAVFYRKHGEGLESWFSGERAHLRTADLGVLDDRPLSWVDVAPGVGSCAEENEAEARQILELVRAFARADAPDGHVAVVCPYAQQRALVKRLLEQDRSTRHVAQVKTIDSVQGREYPVVILGLTRTDGRPGFLASPNRVNVAISRAQTQLVVVGSRSRWLDSKKVRRSAPHMVQLIEFLPMVEVTR